jgi:putative SOS response-associated peptidase YedK
MCGRYTLTSSDQRRLGNRFQISLDDESPGLGRFNVAPTQEVLTVNTDAETGAREAVASRWGLVPFWAKDLKAGYKMINARNDRLLQSKAYGPLVKKSKNRCLIVADGFYEWLKAEKPKEPRQPVRFTVDGGEPFAFAGLTVSREWEGEPLTSCTIVTTDANDVVSRVHDRMPVILPNEEVEQAWLTGDLSAEEAVSLCVPLDAKRMEAKPANPVLNKVGGAKEGPDFLEPPAEDSD